MPRGKNLCYNYSTESLSLLTRMMKTSRKTRNARQYVQAFTRVLHYMIDDVMDYHWAVLGVAIEHYSLPFSQQHLWRCLLSKRVNIYIFLYEWIFLNWRVTCTCILVKIDFYSPVYMYMCTGEDRLLFTGILWDFEWAWISPRYMHMYTSNDCSLMKFVCLFVCLSLFRIANRRSRLLS